MHDLVRIQVELGHDLREGVPLDLREGQEQVFIGQQRVFPPTCLLDRAVDDSLRSISNLAR